MSAITVRGLRKSYGGVEAVRGISFEVAEGEVFGLLGPNGAGKTTTVEVLEGYKRRDGGEVEVLGFDPGHAPAAFRERIGVVLQTSELWGALTVREIHRVFAGYYERPRDVDEVIELVVTSPLLRARETAAAIAKATGAELRVDDRLAPGATLDGLLEAVAGAGDVVVAVGHQPDCSELAEALGAVGLAFAPGTVHELVLE